MSHLNNPIVILAAGGMANSVENQAANSSVEWDLLIKQSHIKVEKDVKNENVLVTTPQCIAEFKYVWLISQ